MNRTFSATTIYSLAVFDDDGPGPNSQALLAGLSYGAAKGLVKWDEANWSTFQGGVSGVDNFFEVNALLSADLDADGPRSASLCVGGLFKQADLVTSFCFAEWLVREDPVLVQNPIDTSICPSSPATFSVQGTTPVEAGPLSYQWRLNGVDLVDGGNTSGATTAMLTIGPGGPVQAGPYDVVITNACNSIVSAPAWLTVIEVLISDTNGDGVVNGLDIEFFVDAIVDHGPPGAPFCASDINLDGLVDEVDLPLFVTALLGI